VKAMGRKKSPGPEISAKASTRLEAVAKATYQRKKTTTEVIPPDVTRAKASAWLTLLSPITEWAGLKGDALNFQRRLLRIQQEETLLRVAESVREKLSGTSISQPVPRKILVPALEKASLEDAADKVMIDRWANLLASAALKVKVQPRFVGILEELAGSQAECLERIAFNRYKDFNYPATIFADSFLDFAEYSIRQSFEAAIRKILTSERLATDALEEIIRVFSRPGVLLGLVIIDDPEREFWINYDSIAETGIRDEEDLSIIESLGLVRYVVIRFDVSLKQGKRKLRVSTYYHHLTNMGVEFCEVCSRPRISEMEKIGTLSHQKNLTRDELFR
jgi:hypothetical protein